MKCTLQQDSKGMQDQTYRYARLHASSVATAPQFVRAFRYAN